MTEDRENLVVRNLRDMQRGFAEVRRSQTADSQRLTRLDRHVEEMRAEMVTALGMASHAYVTVEKSGENLDEIRDRTRALRRRVADLETRP